MPNHEVGHRVRPLPSHVAAGLLGLAVLGTISYGVWIAAGEDPGTSSLANWAYDGTIMAAGLSCFAQAFAPGRVRGTWIAFGVGLVLWGLGDVYLVRVLENLSEIPYPSLADVGFLSALPCLFVGTALLIRRRVGHFTLASWFDGLLAALAAAALGAAFLAPALIGLTDGDPAAVATNLSYPLGDLILLAFISGALVVSGIRKAGTILVLGGGLLIWCLADILYLYQVGTDTYEGGWTDLLWPIGAVIMAASPQLFGAVQAQRRDTYRSSLIPPAISLLIATTILTVDHFDRLHEISIWLAGATILTAVVRLAVSYRENAQLTRALHGEAVTDALTGLGNRRRLLEDLERNLNGGRTSTAPVLFALFDLDGFKAYNDSYGHPAGDALLQRLGANLAGSIESRGAAYRLGGDEFCILAETNAEPAQLVEIARAALSEAGEGFAIGASGGWLLLPEEAGSPSEALRVADQRMYAEKSNSSTRTARQTQDLLMRVLRERDPALGHHVDDVCRRAVELARALSLSEGEIDELARAAKLHDIGKIAIPDDILSKQGPLDDIEWTLMRRHTLIGERILGASPALKGVAQLVRCSHERWDGNGYPDGLSGESIPLGSRIIFISDAFDAMTTTRPYKEEMRKPEAIAELRRCAGTQFDPDLVEPFCSLIADEYASDVKLESQARADAGIPA